MLKAREEVRQKESSTTSLSTTNNNTDKEQKQSTATKNNNNNNINKQRDFPVANTYENFQSPRYSSERPNGTPTTTLIDKNKDALVLKDKFNDKKLSSSNSTVSLSDNKSTTIDNNDNRNTDDAEMNMYERQDSTDDDAEDNNEDGESVYQNFSAINSHYNKRNSKNLSPRESASSTIMSFSTTKPQLNSFAFSKTMNINNGNGIRNGGESAVPQFSSFSSNNANNSQTTTSLASAKSVTLPNKKASSFTPRDMGSTDSNKHKPKFYSLRPPKKPPRLSVLDTSAPAGKSDEDDNVEERNKENLGPACQSEDSSMVCCFVAFVRIGEKLLFVVKNVKKKIN